MATFCGCLAKDFSRIVYVYMTLIAKSSVVIYEEKSTVIHILNAALLNHFTIINRILIHIILHRVLNELCSSVIFFESIQQLCDFSLTPWISGPVALVKLYFSSTRVISEQRELFSAMCASKTKTEQLSINFRFSFFLFCSLSLKTIY